jgi:hypothetical protein
LFWLLDSQHHYANKQLKLKGIRQYIFLLFHFKELLKLYVNLLYWCCVTLLFLEIFWLKIICCPPSWINFYLIIGDFSDVISRVSHIKLHLNDQITLCLVWKVVRQFLFQIVTEVYDLGLIITNCSTLWIKFLRDPAYDVTCISAKIQEMAESSLICDFFCSNISRNNTVTQNR